MVVAFGSPIQLYIKDVEGVELRDLCKLIQLFKKKNQEKFFFFESTGAIVVLPQN